MLCDNIFGMEDKIFQLLEEEIETEKNTKNDDEILAFVKNEVRVLGNFLTSDKAEVVDFHLKDSDKAKAKQRFSEEMPKLNSVRGARRFSQGGFEDEINSFIQGETSRLLYLTEGNEALDSPRRPKLDASNLGEIGEEDEDEDEGSSNSSKEE